MLTKEIIPERVVRSIFSNLGEIYQLHQEMLFALEKRMVNWWVIYMTSPQCTINFDMLCRDNNPRIGDILVERAPFFKVSEVLLLFQHWHLFFATLLVDFFVRCIQLTAFNLRDHKLPWLSGTGNAMSWLILLNALRLQNAIIANECGVYNL